MHGMPLSKALSISLLQSTRLQMSTNHQAGEVPCIRLRSCQEGVTTPKSYNVIGSCKLLPYTRLRVLTTLPFGNLDRISDCCSNIIITVLYPSILLQNERETGFEGCESFEETK